MEDKEVTTHSPAPSSADKVASNKVATSSVTAFPERKGYDKMSDIEKVRLSTRAPQVASR